MKYSRGKPKKWEWAAIAGLTLGGLLLRFPAVPEPLRERLAVILFSSGVLLAVIALWSWDRFQDLPFEEQKELERADRMDERKRMLRERAAWLSWQVETGVLAVGMLSFVVFTKRASLAFFHGVLILWWARMLAFGLFRWLLEKKY